MNVRRRPTDADLRVIRCDLGPRARSRFMTPRTPSPACRRMRAVCPLCDGGVLRTHPCEAGRWDHLMKGDAAHERDRPGKPLAEWRRAPARDLGVDAVVPSPGAETGRRCRLRGLARVRRVEELVEAGALPDPFDRLDAGDLGQESRRWVLPAYLVSLRNHQV
jgi:hypothetical protein